MRKLAIAAAALTTLALALAGGPAQATAQSGLDGQASAARAAPDSSRFARNPHTGAAPTRGP